MSGDAQLERETRELDEAIAARKQAEHEQRERWQLQRLLELGLSAQEADDVFHAGVDWHQVADLLATGCSIKTAIAILL